MSLIALLITFRVPRRIRESGERPLTARSKSQLVNCGRIVATLCCCRIRSQLFGMAVLSITKTLYTIISICLYLVVLANVQLPALEQSTWPESKNQGLCQACVATFTIPSSKRRRPQSRYQSKYVAIYYPEGGVKEENPSMKQS